LTRCGRLQARRRTALLTISPFAIDLSAPFAARLDARALRRRCARTPKSGQLVPAQHGSMARSARACCAGAAAKAPTKRAARRNRRRMWCLGLRFDTHGGGGGGGDGSYLCSTASSCDGVECVFAFPTGARAIGRVGARRFYAAGVSNAAPTGTEARKRRRIARRCGAASEQNRGRRRWRHCLHASPPAI